MFEALVVTLREGIEVALVVGIIAAFLRREVDGRHLGAVWAGIVTALLASLAGGVLLRSLTVNEARPKPSGSGGGGGGRGRNGGGGRGGSRW